MISQETIDAVKDRMSVIDVISEQNTLTKKGADYVCLCPFHGDKNASLHVSASKNLWHCFGCDAGGTAIDFVMLQEHVDFEGAIRYLANKYKIPVEEKADTRTPEQRTEDAKKETIFVIYKYVQQYFVDSLKNDPRAMTYAKGRWNEEQIARDGFGYAPKSGLYKFAKEHTLNIELMKEIGLFGVNQSGRIYDFFYDRITIPIYDKYGRIIGYTARYIGTPEGNAPKYLNSKNSILYQKSESIFGINVAQYTAKEEDKMYLVEGAPDALRMHDINIDNAIACLGANWTEGQFALLKKMVANLCFIPDADPIKFKNGTEQEAIHNPNALDAQFGVGMAKVIKAGKHALELGFNVTVKEVPLKANNAKNDADEYFTSQDKFIGLPEEDFILWYARKIIDRKQPTDVNLPAVNEIAELVSFINDSSHSKLLVSELNKILKGKDVWLTAIANAKKVRIEKNNADTEEDPDMVSLKKLKTFGFQKQNNCYFSMNEKGEQRWWSNFVLEPLFHIKDTPQTALRIFRMINKYGETELIEFKQEDLVSISKFSQKVESLGNFVWLVGGEQLTKLKQYLYKETESATLVPQLGWNYKGFFAFGNGIFYEGKWYPVDENGIVRLAIGNYYLPAFSQIYTGDDSYYKFERSFIYQDVATFTLKEFLRQMILVFGDNAKVAFAFLVASLFRDVVKQETKTFPMLNIFGPKGSGKSELGHCLTSFFINGNIPPNLTTSTLPALAETVAQSSNAVVHLDELKNDLDIEKREFLKGLFDGTGRSRLNMDRDKKRESTKVDSGIVVTGQEMATADIALFTRFVFLTFPKSQFSDEESARFNKLVELRRQGCTHLTTKLLTHRKKFERHYAENYINIGHQLRSDIQDAKVEARMINNWVSIVAAFATVETSIDAPFTLDDLYKVAVDGIKKQGTLCTQNTEIAAFWETIAFLFADGKINFWCEFRIERMMRIKVDEFSDTLTFPEPRSILLFRYLTNYELYNMHRSKVKESTLPKSSMQYYLQVHPAYIGKKGSVLFHAIVDGQQQYVYEKDSEGHEKKKMKMIRDQVMCFDYDMLRQQYHINLEEKIVSEDEDIDEDE